MNHIHDHLLNNLPSSINNWHDKIEFMYRQQYDTWTMMRNHYKQFEEVLRREVQFDGFKIIIQFNKGRARSTCADLSKKVIENRKCFLCANHLPTEQKGYRILDKYVLLVNPFPIFDRHLTISDFNHVPQQIEGRIIDMLSITNELTGYTVFYNGAKCGASAPDHFHFQAAQKGIMPIDSELITQKSEIVFETEDLTITSVKEYLRSSIVFESKYKEPIDFAFHHLIKLLNDDQETGEPMVNILAAYTDNSYRLIVFPRKAQRPSCYFHEGEERIIVSPASVELGGVCVTPRQDDFDRITAADLRTIFDEVCISNLDTVLQQLTKVLK